jgi:hypothetical protein
MADKNKITLQEIKMKTNKRKIWMTISYLIVISTAVLSITAVTGYAEQTPKTPIEIKAVAELGTLAPITHTIQFDKTGTVFDYVNEGGQDNLFLFSRISLEMAIDRKHTVILLYQPLTIETSVLLQNDLSLDKELFPAGTPMNLLYGFDFYRVSYLYDFWYKYPDRQIAIGGSLQLRNATLNFTSADGTKSRTNRDVGPVPLLKFRIKYTFDTDWWIGGEIDAIYAPVKYINGSNTDVVGALIDANVRVGLPINDYSSTFLNLRYLAGGAEGTSQNNPGPGDGFTANWLQFLTLSAGAELKIK